MNSREKNDRPEDPRLKLIEGIMYGLVISTFLWGMIIAAWLLF